MKDVFDYIPQNVEKNGTSMEVDDNDKDATEGEVADETRFIPSADAKPNFKANAIFRTWK